MNRKGDKSNIFFWAWMNVHLEGGPWVPSTVDEHRLHWGSAWNLRTSGAKRRCFKQPDSPRIRNQNGFSPFPKADRMLENNDKWFQMGKWFLTQKWPRKITNEEQEADAFFFSPPDTQCLKKSTFHTFFLRNLLKDMTQQNEGINSKRGTKE